MNTTNQIEATSDGQSGAEDPINIGTAEQKRLLDAEALFAGGREVAILHGNEEYMLRITKQGKLILTK